MQGEILWLLQRDRGGRGRVTITGNIQIPPVHHTAAFGLLSLGRWMRGRQGSRERVCAEWVGGWICDSCVC